MKNYKLNRLKNGETIITSEKGHSMFPKIKSGQPHRLEPATWESVEVGDIVYCKIGRRFFTHFVLGKNELKGCLIGNYRKNINGWTKNVYGKVIEIL